MSKSTRLRNDEMVRKSGNLRLHPNPKRKIELKILKNLNIGYVGNYNIKNVDEDEYESYLLSLLNKGFINGEDSGSDGIIQVGFPSITILGQDYLNYYSSWWIFRQFKESDWKYFITLIISISAIIIAYYK